MKRTVYYFSLNYSNENVDISKKEKRNVKNHFYNKKKISIDHKVIFSIYHEKNVIHYMCSSADDFTH